MAIRHPRATMGHSPAVPEQPVQGHGEAVREANIEIEQVIELVGTNALR